MLLVFMLGFVFVPELTTHILWEVSIQVCPAKIWETKKGKCLVGGGM